MGNLIYFVLKTFSYLPFVVLYTFADFLFIINYYLIGYRKKVVMENLNIAFPEKTLKEKKEISRAFFHNFSDFIVESIKIFSMTDKSFQKRCDFVNIKEFTDYLTKNNKGAVIYGTHQFNWEWIIYVSSYYPKNTKAHISYTPLSNKTLNRLIKKNRERFGFHLASARDFARTMQDTDKNELSVNGLIADQSPQANYKFYTNFFGKSVPAYTSAENIAKKYNQSYWFVKTQRVKRGHFKIKFELMATDTSNYEDGELTKMSIAKTEDLIRSQPDNYLWTHKRWKHAK